MASRLSSDAWEAAALDALRDDGLAAVAVEPLARRLGVTKGSFYWHFENRDALLAAALARWEREELAGVSGPRSGDLAADLDLLATKALKLVGRPTIQRRLSAEADRDPRIAAVLARVTRARIARIEAIYRDLGLTPARARARAAVAYAAILGLEQLDREGELDVGETTLREAVRAALTP